MDQLDEDRLHPSVPGRHHGRDRARPAAVAVHPHLGHQHDPARRRGPRRPVADALGLEDEAGKTAVRPGDGVPVRRRGPGAGGVHLVQQPGVTGAQGLSPPRHQLSQRPPGVRVLDGVLRRVDDGPRRHRARPRRRGEPRRGRRGRRRVRRIGRRFRRRAGPAQGEQDRAPGGQQQRRPDERGPATAARPDRLRTCGGDPPPAGVRLLGPREPVGQFRRRGPGRDVGVEGRLDRPHEAGRGAGAQQGQGRPPRLPGRGPPGERSPPEGPESADVLLRAPRRGARAHRGDVPRAVRGRRALPCALRRARGRALRRGHGAAEQDLPGGELPVAPAEGVQGGQAGRGVPQHRGGLGGRQPAALGQPVGDGAAPQEVLDQPGRCRRRAQQAAHGHETGLVPACQGDRERPERGPRPVALRSWLLRAGPQDEVLPRPGLPHQPRSAAQAAHRLQAVLRREPRRRVLDPRAGEGARPVVPDGRGEPRPGGD